MKVFETAILLAAYLAMTLMDVAIFFLMIRLMVGVLPVRPLQLLDRVGSEGVEAVSSTINKQIRRWRNWPMSKRQEKALALLVLSVCRLLVGVVVR